MPSNSPNSFDKHGNMMPLTKREREVLGTLAQGFYSDKEIGKELGIRADTVANHMYSIRTKLGANSRFDAFLKALKLGIVEVVMEVVKIKAETEENREARAKAQGFYD